MDPARYERLVKELEVVAQASPATLKRRVRLLVALGYAYVLLVLALLVAAAILVVWLLATLHGLGLFKLVVPLLGLVVVIARSLRVRVDPPQGRTLVEGTAPALDARVAEIRSTLAAPAADHVILNDAFNASVMQVPRWGIFGFPRTYLVLGVPLMLCLTRDQFDAVLAHEFAHLSGSHPKLGLWVYRMSRTWNQLLEQLQKAQLGTPLVRAVHPLVPATVAGVRTRAVAARRVRGGRRRGAHHESRDDGRGARRNGGR
jgi:Zn-dependent protease with chaperone function